MTSSDVKEVLSTKLKDESCYFTKEDIIAKRVVVPNKTAKELGFEQVDSRAIEIQIKDYNHIKFTMYTGTDSDFGEWVMIKETGCFDTVILENAKNGIYLQAEKRALLTLGYHIGNTF